MARALWLAAGAALLLSMAVWFFAAEDELLRGGLDAASETTLKASSSTGVDKTERAEPTMRGGEYSPPPGDTQTMYSIASPFDHGAAPASTRAAGEARARADAVAGSPAANAINAAGAASAPPMPAPAPVDIPGAGRPRPFAFATPPGVGSTRGGQ